MPAPAGPGWVVRGYTAMRWNFVGPNDDRRPTVIGKVERLRAGVWAAWVFGGQSFRSLGNWPTRKAAMRAVEDELDTLGKN